ncbi:uncharacterized protein EI90DRAFT_3115693 [Cantharellus anzutake]|uniref:uncharacterized protein n=1 Tax=Cantharellus anzutake TaxID=1750568 RepID=UPI001904068A|nr:uncharacterized protein EI90DRAFT_3115693 [Cantharellus anzutake]KAF8343175.1 hypothetical protein EI90DRAFT_3115693 [Cantharellus anzutake]
MVYQFSRPSHSSLRYHLKDAELEDESNHDTWTELIRSVLCSLCSGLKEAGVSVVSASELESIAENLDNVERTKCVALITDALRQNKWDPLIRYADMKLRLAPPEINYYDYNQFEVEKNLATAYHGRFIGSAPRSFIRHLDQIDREEGNLNKPRYAKSISVVQSSGAGKSRMLTEVGARIFTLPICLRTPGSSGYPLADEPVSEYFNELKTQCGNNDLSISTVAGIASFFAAAHETMLASLKVILGEGNCARKDVLGSWHRRMEGEGRGAFRVKFFESVMERTKQLKKSYGVGSGNSPKLDDGNGFKRNKEGKKGKKGGPITLARSYYAKDAKKAVEDLMEFIKTLTSGSDPLCITYFDEAHELGMCFWIMLLLLQNQKDSVRMWYVFMGTKSSITYFAPRPQDMVSARLREEQRRLEPPFFALGFDQYAREQAKTPTLVKMGQFETMEHISQYGRPLWRAMLPMPGDELINVAAYKLTAAEVRGFHAGNKLHVFAVLSQRLCLDLVLASAEAAELADRSVSHHLRLLTGLSVNNAILYTHSPSEPILALGAARILYHPDAPNGLLRSVLETLSKGLCHAGLVEKGLMGELAARFLLLTARDFAAPVDGKHRNFLKPVRLLDVLQTLFGGNGWCDRSVKTAFCDAFVNFTHWTITKNFLPQMPSRKLLANLWARGAILQCCFNQTSIDFLCPVYFGSVEPGAIFDCDQLSGLVVQVKNKKEGDTGAQRNLRPAGIIRDFKDPLPYLALLMELEHSQPLQYKRLQEEYRHALDGLSQHREQNPKEKKHLKLLEADVQAKELEKDLYNQYLISARGAGSKTYGILKTAGIEEEFNTFLSIVIPQESPYDDEIAQMWPDHVGDDGWLADYVIDNEG